MVEGGDRALDPTFDLVLVVNRFYIFAVCVSFRGRGVSITQGFEQLTTASAVRFYRTLHHLMVTDPTSSILEDIRLRYHRAFPDGVDFTDLPSRHTVITINTLIRRDWRCRPIWQGDDRPSDPEHIQFAQDISKLAQVEYRQERRVPEWIIGFAFDSLSLDPLPSTSIVADCFGIIAMNSGCDVSDATTSEEGYICFCPIRIHLLTMS